MNNIYIFISVFILVQGFLAFIPYMTRKTENFGVSIPESLYDRIDFKNMRRNYAIIMLVILAIITGIIIIIAFFASEKTLYIAYIISIFLYLISGFAIYLPFHQQMKLIKEKENWQKNRQQRIVIDTQFRNEKLTVSTAWFIIPFLICVLTLAMTFFLYEQIPDELPIHTDFSGNVTYEEKSVGTLLMMPGVQFVMVLVFLFIHYVMNVSKQQVSAENPDVSKQQNIMFRRRWSAFMVATGTLTVMLFFFIQLTFIYPQLVAYEDIVIFTFVGIILIGTVVFSIMTGQGGSRIKLDKPVDDTVIDRDDDRHWKLGQIYFNKEDPAIFIEKRFGVGWTNNWARPMSWIIIGLIILIACSPLLFLLF